MVYISSVPLMPAVILSFLSTRVTSLMQAYKDHEQYFTGVIPVVLCWCMNARSYVDLGLPLPRLEFLRNLPGFATYRSNTRIYIETAIVVVISYLSLLIVNWSYIWLVVFPVIAIGFIAALCNELNHKSGSGSQQQSSDDGEATSAGKGAEGMEAVALVPYWVLCVMGQLNADRFAVSQFLLFFSIMLGALTLMMTRLALIVVDRRGIAPASELLRKASLLVLLVTVHAVAAELLGDNVVLFCLPEIALLLLWFSIHLHRDDNANVITTADEINLDRNNVLVLLRGPAVALVILAASYMDESLLYWCTRALVSCGVSGLLVCYVAFMLWQWPGQDGTATRFAEDTARLLTLWANLLLKVATTLLMLYLLVSISIGLQESMDAASPGEILQRVSDRFLKFAIYI